MTFYDPKLGTKSKINFLRRLVFQILQFGFRFILYYGTNFSFTWQS